MKSSPRPVLLTIVCILGYVWIVFSFPAVFSPSVKKLGDWFPALFGLLVAGTFMSFIGTWHMKKWGAELFAYVTIVKILTQTLLNDFGTVSRGDAIISIAFSIVFMVFYKRMERGL